jgi:hypothetical protein
MQFRGASPDLASGLAQQAVNDIADSSSGYYFEVCVLEKLAAQW